MSATRSFDGGPGIGPSQNNIMVEASSQFYYCQMCQGLMRFFDQTAFEERRIRRKALYELDIATVMSEGKCCCCAMIAANYKDGLRHLEVTSQSMSEEGIKRCTTQGVIVASYHRASGCVSLESDCFSGSLYVHPRIGEYTYDHFVTESTDSDKCWDLANNWLKLCLSGHPCCILEPSAKLQPTRLLKISLISTRFHLRLVETESLPSMVKYCTLSHCWGDGDFLKLLRSNYDEFKKSIPYERLSKTFRDAIYAAYRMGFEFIWIDSLCIIQTDEEDWRREASAMSSVYSGSSLNLAASSSRDGHHGLFRSRNYATVLPCESRQLDFSINDFIVHWIHLWETEVSGSRLSRRAWVVQERVLARRTLHFGHDQLLWECIAGCACEKYPSDPIHNWNPLPALLRLIRNSDLKVAWQLIVESYSIASLSFASDKLVAISGVAKSFSEKGLGVYVAGLWRDGLELDLLWFVAHSKNLASRPTNYRAPSWSWAALDGVTIHTSETIGDLYFWRFKMHYGTCIQVLDALVKLKFEGDVFGQVSSASLEICCTQLKVLPNHKPNHRGEIRELFNGTEMIHIHLDVIDLEGNLPKDILLLHVLTFKGETVDERVASCSGLTGLLIQPSESELNSYKRIGVFWIDAYPSSRYARDGAADSTLSDESDTDTSDAEGSNDEPTGNDREEKGEILGDGNSVDERQDHTPGRWGCDIEDVIDDEMRFEAGRDNGDSQAPVCYALWDEGDNDTTDNVDKKPFKPTNTPLLIWSNLKNAEMHERAPKEALLEDGFAETFIITLV